MRVLIVVHGYPPAARGGSEVYAEAHARTLRDSFGDDVLVLTRDNDPARPECEVRETQHRGVRVVRINHTFRTVRSFEESYTQPRIAALAAELIDTFAPDVAHIHHLTCLSTQIPAHLHSRGVPCVMTLHDYWLLCHRGQLLDRDCRVCVTPGACGRCVDESAAVPAVVGSAAAMVRRVEPHLPPAGRRAVRAIGNLVASGVSSGGSAQHAASARRAHMREVASHITRFYAPSAHLRGVFINAGFPADRIDLSPYGFERDRFTRSTPGPDAPPLRIGFIGSLMLSKGPHVLLEAFRRLPAGAATLALYGAYAPYHGDDAYRAVLEPLLRTPHVTLHAWRPEREMHRAYADLDVLVVPSIWPENSPLVIHEALLSGVPVVASDIGGIPERVRHYENGLLFPAGNIDALHAELLRLLQEPALLSTLASQMTPVRTIEDDTRTMRDGYTEALYQADLKVGSYTHRGVGRDTPRDVHAVVLNYHTPEQTLLTVRSLLAQTPPLASVTVVDNSDTTECGRTLAELSDRVDYVSTAENLGYSGGMNVGIARALHAGATHVLLVNSDVTVPPDCTARLVDALTAEPGAGIAGPTLLARDTPDRIDSAGLLFDVTSGRMRMRLAGERVASTPAASTAVNAVSGCLMLVERRVFEHIGLLDDHYFFGFEDLDFCLRARAAGIGTVVSPARAYHARAQSLPSRSPDRLYYAARNHLRLASSIHGGNAGPARQLGVLLLNVASALKASPSHAAPRLLAVAGGCFDFYRGQFGPRR